MSYVTIRRPEILNPAPLAEVPPPTQPTDISAQVNEEIERRRAQAESEGRAHGAEQGRAEAKAATEAARHAAISAFHAATRQLEAPLAGLEDDIAEMVTDLAFILARHIIGAELQTNAESIRALVSQLLREAASERNPGRNILVRVNPEDEKTLQNEDQPENTKLIGDASITRGGAIIEITSPRDPVEKIEWDATIEARLAILRNGLALPGDGEAP